MSAPPLFYSMVSQNVVSSPQFSFKLSLTSGKSSLFLGGADPSLYVSGSRKWYDVNPKLWFWNITGTAYVSGATTGAGSFGAIIDTGCASILTKIPLVAEAVLAGRRSSSPRLPRRRRSTTASPAPCRSAPAASGSSYVFCPPLDWHCSLG